VKLGPTGTVAEQTDPVLVRVHSECLTGDFFGSGKCAAAGNFPPPCR